MRTNDDIEIMKGYMKTLLREASNREEFAIDTLNYAYHNWSVLGGEETNEIDSFNDNGDDYLSYFPEKIRAAYKNYLINYMNSDDRRQRVNIANNIIKLLRPYVSEETSKYNISQHKNIIKQVDDETDTQEVGDTEQFNRLVGILKQNEILFLAGEYDLTLYIYELINETITIREDGDTENENCFIITSKNFSYFKVNARDELEIKYYPSESGDSNFDSGDTDELIISFDIAMIVGANKFFK